MKKLEEKDYLRRVFSRSPDGRFDSIDYITCRGCKIGNLPYAENPHTVNPQAENQKQLNTNKSKINNVLNNNQSITDECNSPYYERQAYEQLIKENIDYDSIINSQLKPKGNLYYTKDIIDEVYSIIIDTLCCAKATIRIGGSELPAETVKDVLLKLNYVHIHIFFERMNNTYTKKTHMKNYVLSALYDIVITENISALSECKADGTIP